MDADTARPFKQFPSYYYFLGRPSAALNDSLCTVQMQDPIDLESLCGDYRINNLIKLLLKIQSIDAAKAKEFTDYCAALYVAQCVLVPTPYAQWQLEDFHKLNALVVHTAQDKELGLRKRLSCTDHIGSIIYGRAMTPADIDLLKTGEEKVSANPKLRTLEEIAKLLSHDEYTQWTNIYKLFPNYETLGDHLVPFTNMITQLKTETKAAMIIYAAYIHWNFVQIHPWLDGNGRTSRIITAVILLNSGILPYYFANLRDRTDYIKALWDESMNQLADLTRRLIERSNEKHQQQLYTLQNQPLETDVSPDSKMWVTKLFNKLDLSHESALPHLSLLKQYALAQLHIPSCAFCHTIFNSEQALKSCGSCKVARYCTKECQRKDWGSHKLVCKDVAGISNPNP